MITRSGFVFAVVVAFSLSVRAQTPVDLSDHNLSPLGGTSGRNYVSNDKNTAACIFCHAPHNTKAVRPLFNRDLPTANPTPYMSSTFPQQTSPVSDRSKECLSCHDGTIALGQTLSSGNLGLTASMTGKNVVSDLQHNHPVSFVLPAVDDGEVSSWLRTTPLTSPDSAVRLSNNRIECSTCHEPHFPDIDPVNKMFLSRKNDGGGLCLVCHDQNRGTMLGWSNGAHTLATNTSSSPTLPYKTVALNGCGNCHQSHNAAEPGSRLLSGSGSLTCANCHSNSSLVTPAPADIISIASNASNFSHPVMISPELHDPVESLPVSQRHVQCADCHNAHASQASALSEVPPTLQLPMRGINGMTADGLGTLATASNEYEVCLKCHGSSANKPQNATYTAYGRTAFRQSQSNTAPNDTYNVSKEFSSAISRHNVISARSGYNSPSLRTAAIDYNGNPTSRSLQSGSIYCSDCHNSDQAQSAGRSGPNGPHGSAFQHLLERRYEINLAPAMPGSATNQIVFSTGSSGPYALCDKCHDVTSLVNGSNDQIFKYHGVHIQQGGISCSSCHGSHGVQGSDTTHHQGLVDLDVAMATFLDGTLLTGIPASGYGPNDLINTDPTQRTCNLVCHGKTHDTTNHNNSYK